MPFDLTTRMGYDGRGFSAGMAQTLGEAKQASSKMSSLFASAFSGGGAMSLLGGAAGAVGLGSAFEKVSEMVDHVRDSFKDIKIGMAQMGTDLDTFQQIKNVTTITGTGPEAFAVFVEHLAVSLEKIRNGSPGFEKLIEQANHLGITVEDIKAKGAFDIGLQILRGFKGAGPASDATRAALHELGGRSAGALYPAGQLGLDSRAANAGKFTAEEYAMFQNISKVEKLADADAKKAMHSIGVFFNEFSIGIKILLAEFGRFSLGKKYLTVEAIENQRAEKKARDDAAVEKEAKDKIVAASSAKYIAEQNAKNQHTADLKVASDLDKDTAKLRSEARKAEETAAFQARSKDEKAAFLQEKGNLARAAEKDYNRQADGAKYEGDREKDEAYFRNLAVKNRLAAADADKALGELDRKKERHIKSDALLDVGNFLGGGERDESMDELRKMNDNIQQIRQLLASPFGNPPLTF